MNASSTLITAICLNVLVCLFMNKYVYTVLSDFSLCTFHIPNMVNKVTYIDARSNRYRDISYFNI